MTGQLTAAHLSGDLGQAIATSGGTTWLVDTVDQREPLLNEVQLFFATAMEIVSFNGESLANITLDGLQARLRAEAPGYELLDLLLAGMDPELSERTRLDAIDQAAKLASRADSLAFAQRRLLRATEANVWDAKSAAQIAEKSGNLVLAELYQIIAGPLLARIESSVLSWHRGVRAAITQSAFLEIARDTGLIAEVAIATQRQNWDAVRAATVTARDRRILGLSRHLRETLIPSPPPPPPPLPPEPLPSEDYNFKDNEEFQFVSRRIVRRSTWADGRFALRRAARGNRFDSRLLRFALEQGRLDQLIAPSKLYSSQLLEAAFRMADHPCFFVDDPDARWDLRRDELLRTIYDQRFEIAPLPSREQVRAFTAKRAMTLTAILKIDFALGQFRNYYWDSSLPSGLGQSSIVSSIFVARPEELRELRGQARLRSAELSHLIFGRAGNIWGQLERSEARDHIGITWATVEKIATVLGNDALYVFKPVHELPSASALRALDRRSGNIVASSR